MEERFKHFEEVNITLNIKSNRSYPQTANLMGNPYDLLDTSNSNTEYKWDLTGFVFTTETYVTLQYKDVNQVAFLLYTQNLAAQSLDAVVNALNLLGLGFFNHFTSGGSTFIVTNNNQYVFGDLSLEPSGSGTTTTTTTTSTTAAPTTTTTSTTTTAAPTTSTTTTSTSTSSTSTTTTTSTTTAPDTSTTTTTSTTTAPDTSTTTTTSTTTAPDTSTTTTTSTTTAVSCLCYSVTNNTGGLASYDYTPCGTGTPVTVSIPNATTDQVCSEVIPTSASGLIIAACVSVTNCTNNSDCTGCYPATTTTSTTSTTTAPDTSTTTTTSTTTAPDTSTTTTTSTTTAPDTSTTTTSTTSTTTQAVFTFCLGYDASSSSAACTDYLNCIAP